MRTSKKYTIKEALAILSQYFISRVSLWYFRNVNNRSITLIRKQGIGDAIFATGVLDRFSEKYPNTKIRLVANIPQVFEKEAYPGFSLKDFPLVWMMYEHYDFSFLRKKDKHITQIIGEHLGLDPRLEFQYQIPITEGEHTVFLEEHIKGKDYIVIHPWAGGWNMDRNWTLEQWNLLLKEIQKKRQMVYQVGAATDPLVSGTIDFRGKTSLPECFLLIKQASLFIGVNSFGEQAAGAFQVPSVILYGSTHPIYSLNPNQTAVFASGYASVHTLESFHYTFRPASEIPVNLVLGQVEKLGSLNH